MARNKEKSESGLTERRLFLPTRELLRKDGPTCREPQGRMSSASLVTTLDRRSSRGCSGTRDTEMSSPAISALLPGQVPSEISFGMDSSVIRQSRCGARHEPRNCALRTTASENSSGNLCCSANPRCKSPQARLQERRSYDLLLYHCVRVPVLPKANMPRSGFGLRLAALS